MYAQALHGSVNFNSTPSHTLRLHLIKLAARIVETKRRITVHLPTAYPDQGVLRLLLERIPRLVT
jgi:hypothetical protein